MLQGFGRLAVSRASRLVASTSKATFYARRLASSGETSAATRSEIVGGLRALRLPFDVTAHTGQISTDCSKCGSTGSLLISTHDGTTTCTACEHASSIGEFFEEHRKTSDNRKDLPEVEDEKVIVQERDPDLHDSQWSAKMAKKLNYKKEKRVKAQPKIIAPVELKPHPAVRDVWRAALASHKDWPEAVQDVLADFGLDRLPLEFLSSCGIRVLPATVNAEFKKTAGAMLVFPRFSLSRRSNSVPVSLKLLESEGDLKLAKRVVPSVDKESARTSGVSAFGLHNKLALRAFVVKTERDALALHFADPKLHIFVVPDSKDSSIIPFLERYDEIHLWYPSGYRNEAHELAKLLGPRRCHWVAAGPGERPIELLNRDDSAKILEVCDRKLKPVLLESYKTFADLKSMACDELTKGRDRSHGFASFKRFAPLNEYLGGLRPGELTVLTGPTGAGKTTFVCEYTVDFLTQGVRVLMCSLEMRSEAVLSTMLKQFSYRYLADAATVEAWSDRFERVRGDLIMLEALQCERKSIAQIARFIEEQVVAAGTQLLIVDNLQFLVGLANQHYRTLMDKIGWQDTLVGKFRQLATRTGAHVMLVVHPRKRECDSTPIDLQTIGGSGRITQEADTVLVLQRPPPQRVLRSNQTSLQAITAGQQQSPEGHNCLRILKNRFMGRRMPDYNLEVQFNPLNKTHTIVDKSPVADAGGSLFESAGEK